MPVNEYKTLGIKQTCWDKLYECVENDCHFIYTNTQQNNKCEFTHHSTTETETFFQTVGRDPGFIRLSVPFICTARMKQSLVKCTEHIPNEPFGLKFFLCWHTNLFHCIRTLPFVGELCIEIPNSLSATRLQSWTTQRLGAIFEDSKSSKTLRKLSNISHFS